jgi:xylulokinase
VKAAAYSMNGVLAMLAVEPVQIVHPRPEWSEFVSAQIWESVCMCIRAVCGKVGGKNIKGVGVSSCGEQGIPMDKNGNTLHTAIAWFDTRCAEQCERLSQKISRRRIYSATGQILSPKYGIGKSLWIRDNYPEIFERTAHWLSMEDFVIYRLTGEIVTDYSIAARTMAFDVNSLDWSEEILGAAEIPASIMSRAVPGGTVAGGVTRLAAEETGLAKDTKVVTGGHDHACSAISVNILEDGVVLDSMRTAESAVVAASSPILNDEAYRNWICVYPHCGPKLYRILTSNSACGGAIDWYLSTMGRDIQLVSMQTGANKYDLVFEDAKLSASGIPGLYFIPFVRGLLENDSMRGAFIGMRDDHKSGDFVKAILVGLSYEMILQISRCESIFSEELVSLRIVGNAAKSDFWMKTKSSVMGRMMEIPMNKEAATYGAAILAAVGTGVADFSRIAKFYSPGNAFCSSEERDREQYREGYQKYLLIREAISALYRAKVL